MSLNIVRVGVLSGPAHDYQHVMDQLRRWTAGYNTSTEVRTLARFMGFESMARLAGREVPSVIRNNPAPTRRTVA